MYIKNLSLNSVAGKPLAVVWQKQTASKKFKKDGSQSCNCAPKENRKRGCSSVASLKREKWVERGKKKEEKVAVLLLSQIFARRRHRLKNCAKARALIRECAPQMSRKTTCQHDPTDRALLTFFFAWPRIARDQNHRERVSTYTLLILTLLARCVNTLQFPSLILQRNWRAFSYDCTKICHLREV